jgi:Pyridine nucleotide-disulphide oxidoreductase, dimerisation domain
VVDPSGAVAGVHMIGHGVSELIGEAQLLYDLGVKAAEGARFVHAHPTQNEAPCQARRFTYTGEGRPAVRRCAEDCGHYAASILGVVARRGSSREVEAAVLASRPAVVATHGYPALPQHLSNLGGGLAGSVEHLVVGESDG